MTARPFTIETADSNAREWLDYMRRVPEGDRVTFNDQARAAFEAMDATMVPGYEPTLDEIRAMAESFRHEDLEPLTDEQRARKFVPRCHHCDELGPVVVLGEAYGYASATAKVCESCLCGACGAFGAV